jgi:Tfp pilus assembly protein PilO
VVLSKRERYIVIVTVAVVAILGLDQFFVSPLLAKKSDLDGRIDSAEKEVAKQSTDVDLAKRARHKWAQAAGNTVKRDAPEVESQVNNSVRQWGQDSRMNVTSFRQDRIEKEKGFTKITYLVTGAGSMDQIGRFLHRIQTSKIPIRIVDLQITTKKEGGDDLILTVKVASIFEQPEPEKPAARANQSDARASWEW